jgi:predicted kinase
VHLRVDTLEQGLMRGGLQLEHLAAQGYGAAYAVAADQLAVGLTVVTDMVNGVEEARHAWAQVAEQADARLLRVLVECSDADEHRRRVETRTADIEGHRLPDWHQASTRELAPWPEAEVRVDTATDSLEEAVTRLAEALR